MESSNALKMQWNQFLFRSKHYAIRVFILHQQRFAACTLKLKPVLNGWFEYIDCNIETETGKKEKLRVQLHKNESLKISSFAI